MITKVRALFGGERANEGNETVRKGFFHRKSPMQVEGIGDSGRLFPEFTPLATPLLDQVGRVASIQTLTLENFSFRDRGITPLIAAIVQGDYRAAYRMSENFENLQNLGIPASDWLRIRTEAVPGDKTDFDYGHLLLRLEPPKKCPKYPEALALARLIAQPGGLVDATNPAHNHSELTIQFLEAFVDNTVLSARDRAIALTNLGEATHQHERESHIAHFRPLRSILLQMRAIETDRSYPVPFEAIAEKLGDKKVSCLGREWTAAQLREHAAFLRARGARD